MSLLEKVVKANFSSPTFRKTAALQKLQEQKSSIPVWLISAQSRLTRGDVHISDIYLRDILT